MRNKTVRTILISCILWLLPGLAAGSISAAVLSIQQYEHTASLTEGLLQEESLSKALKNASVSDGKPIHGKQYLVSYGYNELYYMLDYLPFMLGLHIVLFELAGAVVCYIKFRRESRCITRIEGLEDYLKAAGKGRAGVLTRQEDIFSNLEDEIYKTVIRLECTKEEAIKDHEILKERIADIAHQLKTPLTSMSLMAELMEAKEPEEQEYLVRLRHQVERLKGLAEGLLTMAKLDSHTLLFERETLDIVELIEESCEVLKEDMKRKRVTVKIGDNQSNIGGILLEADVRWTGEAFLNILKNCIEHTPKDSEIEICIEKNPLYTQIIIEDGGPGFSKSDLPHLFERFYRGEHAAKDSAGIGLALAKLILERQNGQIRAENSAGGHARFCIRFY